MPDMAFQLFGELVDTAHNLEMVPADDLFHGPLAGFQIIHPDLQPAYVGLDLDHIGLELANVGLDLDHVGLQPVNVGLQPANVGLQPANVGLQPANVDLDLDHFGIQLFDRRKYSVVLVHAAAPAIVI